jgi:perosamine synthetase
MSNGLAVFGGRPIRSKPFPPHPIIGAEEKRAVLRVLESGKLSTFIASPGEYFLGGVKIREFEQRFCEHHGLRYAIAFNSATAALHAAVVAVGVKPGQEVVTTPYTFTSTATCALMHNAIPVFADIESETFGLDPGAVERAITPLTAAIIVVHLFGHPARIDGIIDVAHRHNLKLIEDCAQAPGAEYGGRLVGTFGDCGIFSFTENKNITTGEGGMLITNDQKLAELARMIRNHGEAILQGPTSRTYSCSILGWNYRMTEIEAALGIAQFAKMEDLNGHRAELASRLSAGLSSLPGIQTPRVAPGAKHVFYAYALKYDEAKVGIPRNLFVKALNAEGIPFSSGYVRPLYLTPLYQGRQAFAFENYRGLARYDKGLCPTAERLHEKELMLTEIVRPPATVGHIDDIAAAFAKVFEHRAEFGRASHA